MFRYILLIIFLAIAYYIVKLLFLNSPGDRSIQNIKAPPEHYLIDMVAATDRLERDVKIFAETIGTRSIFEPEKLKEAENYIISKLKKYGAVKRYPYNYEQVEVANLELDIFTEDDNGDILIIGAHYDTDSLTPGADDNASSVAELLELAGQAYRLKEAKQLKQNLRFVAFTLEEPPAFSGPNMGSKRYIIDLKKRNERIKGMICLEMVGYKSTIPGSQEIPFPLNLKSYSRVGDFIAFVANTASLKLLEQLISATEFNNSPPYEKLVVPGKGGLFPIARLSDHIAFWDSGYPAIMVTDTAFLRNPNYHGPGDKADTLDYEFMARLAQTLIMLF